MNPKITNKSGCWVNVHGPIQVNDVVVSITYPQNNGPRSAYIIRSAKESPKTGRVTLLCGDGARIQFN